MGFNNDGVHSLVEKIQRSFPKEKRSVPLGINLGKGKSTPLDLALEDYCKGFDVVAKQADYITINVSSPNTPNLRQLQNNEFLQPLLHGIKEHREKWSIDHSVKSPPCLLKISPDESFKNLEQIISKAVENKFDGIIASNTSIDSSCIHFAKSVPTGGISGKPLSARSDEVIRFISKLTNEKLPIIGSGGIFDYESAQKKLDSGACLLQIYTSFIYRGPLWPSKLARRIPLANSLI
jgi:dihydroorotate dehydrogenase